MREISAQLDPVSRLPVQQDSIVRLLPRRWHASPLIIARPCQPHRHPVRPDSSAKPLRLGWHVPRGHFAPSAQPPQWRAQLEACARPLHHSSLVPAHPSVLSTPRSSCLAHQDHSVLHPRRSSNAPRPITVLLAQRSRPCVLLDSSAAHRLSSYHVILRECIALQDPRHSLPVRLDLSAALLVLSSLVPAVRFAIPCRHSSLTAQPDSIAAPQRPS